jgi:hypothetical protein
MNLMFKDAVSFNQNISNWCVSKFVSEPTDFSFNSPLIFSNKPVWGNWGPCAKTPITNANFQTGGEVIPVQIIIDFRYG